MRNLTIKREKSFVGSLVKMKIYIEDLTSNEININNTPCRKIGELKNGEERTLNLLIEPDGAVKYTYGIVNSEVLEQYEGTWSLENDILKFEFSGGQLESIENPVVIDPHDCIAFFEWDVDAEGLMLKHIDGDEIIYGTKGRTFEFFVNEY